jgi:hypothetical protein
MLALILDEQISPVVATQTTNRRPDVSIQSIFHWRGGALLTQRDQLILQATAEDRLTLVTYDVTTIRPLVRDWTAAGLTHEGVIFVQEKTIRSQDFGRLVRAIEWLWDTEHQANWTNRVHFLRAP